MLLRALRLDPSDTLVFPLAAEQGEWAVPGGFCWWDDADGTLSGKRRQAFRAGFLGLRSRGWTTLVEVAEADGMAREEALHLLARLIRDEHGAPDDAASRAAAAEELAFAQSLCEGQAPGTVLALARRFEGGELRETFRTLHRREAPHRDFGRLPVFAVAEVADDDAPPERPDLTRLAAR